MTNKERKVRKQLSIIKLLEEELKKIGADTIEVQVLVDMLIDTL